MEQKNEQPGSCSGLVTEATGSTYTVIADDGRAFRSRTYPGTKTENEETSLVAVGDRVELKVTETGTEQFEAVVTLVKQRRSALTRKRDIRRNRSKEKIQVIAANIDQLVVVVSSFDPPLSTRLVDRYLVFAESEQLDVLVVVNKMDLADPLLVAELMAPYHKLGYSVFYTSVCEQGSLQPLMEALGGKLSAFSGHSGVGKSTLINLLFGQKQLKTRRTNLKTGKGVHTTSNSVMLPLPDGGYVIDTPGIREFNLSDITRENLRFYFREFLAFMPDCSFSSCSHTGEPGCGVQRAVHEGGIDPARYESYLAIYYSLE
ncbi:ribosome small subunit-dependent GTPase A [Chlorobium sp. BLA1]|uniref:ribosome small subunit-dependent GTPase A n=1 Tax=Candidatus Chlorobium masyuteum TaxID=2716876 RepID=UPI00141E7A22|nr:ribosome small subunit-dependent GTPase A [Candidatus Chlorobium masyuteum]NHQ60018.1 ribosome small subunit-dependent GTPase A [Candidatus Chlorobium masyuteum]